MNAGNSTVNIAFRNDLLGEIDAMARKQSRSRSELIREAARLYIQGQRRWDAIFAATASALQDTGLTGADVAREIKQVRSGPRRAKG